MVSYLQIIKMEWEVINLNKCEQILLNILSDFKFSLP